MCHGYARFVFFLKNVFSRISSFKKHFTNQHTPLFQIHCGCVRVTLSLSLSLSLSIQTIGVPRLSQTRKRYAS